jgi:hypothetical protein
MHRRSRRRMTVAAAAVFAIGAAFAAQPTSLRADWGRGLMQRMPWIPGTASAMSAHDPNSALLTQPPR